MARLIRIDRQNLPRGKASSIPCTNVEILTAIYSRKRPAENSNCQLSLSLLIDRTTSSSTHGFVPLKTGSLTGAQETWMARVPVFGSCLSSQDASLALLSVSVAQRSPRMGHVEMKNEKDSGRNRKNPRSRDTACDQMAGPGSSVSWQKVVDYL
ncbi:hypothetical protein ZHAS_00022319 [Anopheles sinensis]|uniref:Uncharacterized protein n=1 Tax=Anopheles sinensis TaxID=74873 RepID=A0A084WUI1_ANOSI|nr:hypothetical protein ZHAS_00022319 [Anopheles sinensis]